MKYYFIKSIQYFFICMTEQKCAIKTSSQLYSKYTVFNNDTTWWMTAANDYY